jgi:hypothetical protein
MTMNRSYIFTLAVLMMLGCSRPGPIERRVGKRVDSCQPDAPCVVRIKELTDFQWDKLYAFSDGAQRSDIEKAIGTPFPEFVEFTRRLVFLNDGKIVYREDEPTDVEHEVDGQVHYTGRDTEPYTGLNTEPSYLMFTPESAVFSAKSQEHSHGVAYVLTQMK